MVFLRDCLIGLMGLMGSGENFVDPKRISGCEQGDF